MRLPRRRWMVLGAILAGLGALTALSLWVVYPRVGSWYIRTRVLPRLERKLGNKAGEGNYASQLRGRYPTSKEYQAFLKGNFE